MIFWMTGWTCRKAKTPPPTYWLIRSCKRATISVTETPAPRSKNSVSMSSYFLVIFSQRPLMIWANSALVMNPVLWTSSTWMTCLICSCFLRMASAT